ncbi:hypothetical protein BS47DRAFT_1386229 [Hydnum rufescens UP504]|uniref:Uncharacterized protein n=1 Tax=Hydnum rufescens UP504 TaxID=1448309 RepID=A0A9P6DIY3_9AGAM|nr:hypothetical protein BS47DRAFT_1386229 [Hydnum rufescens UP504]
MARFINPKPQAPTRRNDKAEFGKTSGWVPKIMLVGYEDPIESCFCGSEDPSHQAYGSVLTAGGRTRLVPAECWIKQNNSTTREVTFSWRSEPPYGGILFPKACDPSSTASLPPPLQRDLLQSDAELVGDQGGANPNPEERSSRTQVMRGQARFRGKQIFSGYDWILWISAPLVLSTLQDDGTFGMGNHWLKAHRQ